MTRDALLGLDLGTSSLKALLLGADGTTLGEHVEGYPTTQPQPGWSEQDPEAWWRACERATRAALEAARRSHGPLEVRGIGLSGQMHTVVLVDAGGRPLRPAITWMDTRAQGLLTGAERRIEEAGLAPELANPVVLSMTLLPLLWLRAFEPTVLEQATALLVAKDALRVRLTGVLCSEPTDASATLLADVPGRRWSSRLAQAFELPEGLLPPLVASDAAAGTLLPEAAHALGLPAGIPVAAGAGDQQAAAVGMGTLRPGQMQLMVGTGAQVLAVRERAEPDPAGRLHTFCHVRGFVQQASVNNAGAALDWARQLLGARWEEVYAAPLDQPHLPAFVPYLTGERTPLMKGYARGAWLGLEPGHDRASLLAAAVVGVITSIADGVQAVLASGAVRGAVRASGGGLREPRFAQAVADAIGLPLALVRRGAASAVGAALLGGVAAGVYPDVEVAAAQVADDATEPVMPRADAAALWQARCAWRAALDERGVHEHVAARPEAAVEGTVEGARPEVAVEAADEPSG